MQTKYDLRQKLYSCAPDGRPHELSPKEIRITSNGVVYMFQDYGTSQWFEISENDLFASYDELIKSITERAKELDSIDKRQEEEERIWQEMRAAQKAKKELEAMQDPGFGYKAI